MAALRPSYPAGHFLFRLDDDGGDAAYLRSAAGGLARASPVQERAGQGPLQHNHLGLVDLEPVELEIGMALARPLLGWLDDSLRRRYGRRNAAIIHADANLRGRLEHELGDALLVEARFPVLDGAAREPAYLGFTLQPEWIDLRDGDGRVLSGTLGHQQKRWLPSSFRLAIDGVDCEQVNRVEAFKVKQLVQALHTGSRRLPELEPVGLALGPLEVQVAAAHAADFIAWHRTSVVAGCTRAERSGALELLSPDRRETLFTLRFDRLGLVRLSIERSEANAEQIKRVKAEMYVGGLALELGRGLG